MPWRWRPRNSALRWDTVRGRVTGSARAAQLLAWNASGSHDNENEADAREILDVVHADDREQLTDALRHSLADGMPLDVEFRVVAPGSSPRWIRMTGRVPQLNKETPVGLIYGVVADIEPRKAAEAERAELLRRLGEAQENEQRRIARELHDQVGQTVTGLSLGLKSLEQLLGDGAQGEVGRHVQWLQSLAGEIGRDIHRAAVDLRPTALDDLGLRDALATLLRQWTLRHDIRSDFQVLGESVRLPAAVETAIYRIVQEALTNVIKHAQASTVSVSVEQRPEEVRVIIEDDGVGFDGETVPEPHADGMSTKPRLGLSGIRERLSLLRGGLTLESSPGSGTTLFVRIPFPQQLT